MNQNNIYNQSKIYKIEPIIEHEDHEIYIGSTTKKYLSQRLQQHKSSYKAFLDNKAAKVYAYDLFNKYGVDNFNIYLLENYNCNDINELKSKEGEYIRKLKCINKRIEDRTKKEYYEDNKDKIKQYREDNKDKLKQYREDNKDKLKQYREDNKEKIKEYEIKRCKDRKEKIKCVCGCEIRKSELKRHQRTNKHKQLLKEQEQEQENIIN